MRSGRAKTNLKRGARLWCGVSGHRNRSSEPTSTSPLGHHVPGQETVADNIVHGIRNGL